MNALSALGLDYGSDDDDDDDDEQEKEQSKEPPTAAAAAVPPEASKPPALPDAGDLLSGLPDEVDWSARAAEDDDEPQYDAKGTKYNAVALPQSMAQEQTSFNATTGAKKAGAGGGWKQSGANAAASVAAGLAAVDAAVAGGSSSGGGVSSSGGGGGSAPARRLPKAPTGAGGVLLPPQMRGRPNVTTEELSSMRTAKRPKPSSSK